MNPPRVRVPATCNLDERIWEQFRPLVFEGYKDHSWLVSDAPETYLAIMIGKTPSLKEFQIHRVCDQHGGTIQTSFTISREGQIRSAFSTLLAEPWFDDRRSYAGFHSPRDQTTLFFMEETIKIVARLLEEIQNYGRSIPTVAQQILDPRDHSR